MKESIYIHGNTLKHAYASPYYDPVKAHEYYEEHKKLKGRTSTSGLNEKGREAASYVKKQIDDRRTSDLESRKLQYEDERKAEELKAKTDISDYARNTQNQIDQLQNELLSMTAAQKRQKGPIIRQRIDRLKKDNSNKRASLIEAYRGELKKLRDTYTSDTKLIKTKADEDYVSELDKIKSDASMLSEKKEKGKGTESKGPTFGVKEYTEKYRAKGKGK